MRLNRKSGRNKKRWQQGWHLSAMRNICMLDWCSFCFGAATPFWTHTHTHTVQYSWVLSLIALPFLRHHAPDPLQWEWLKCPPLYWCTHKLLFELDLRPFHLVPTFNSPPGRRCHLRSPDSFVTDRMTTIINSIFESARWCKCLKLFVFVIHK